jgi:hypothetical protein
MMMSILTSTSVLLYLFLFIYSSLSISCSFLHYLTIHDWNLSCIGTSSKLFHTIRTATSLQSLGQYTILSASQANPGSDTPNMGGQVSSQGCSGKNAWPNGDEGLDPIRGGLTFGLLHRPYQVCHSLSIPQLLMSSYYQDDDDDEYTNTFSAFCSFYSYTPHFPSSFSFSISLYPYSNCS